MGPGAVQPGLDRAHRHSRKILNFCEFIAFRVVQQHDQAVLITELGKGFIEPL